MAYREFTTGGYWRALQHYEFNHSVQERRKQRDCFLLSVGRQERERKSKEVNFLSLCCSFFIILFWLMAVYLQGHKQPEISMKQQRGLGSCQN